MSVQGAWTDFLGGMRTGNVRPRDVDGLFEWDANVKSPSKGPGRTFGVGCEHEMSASRLVTDFSLGFPLFI
ncbi:hypothetical protein [Bacillus sp. JJ1474]|uniref:hypothetical protein n=1 Tax=Bacillus sp. JJ1474 TaxID=3122955 RepID=UPI003000C566